MNKIHYAFLLAFAAGMSVTSAASTDKRELVELPEMMQQHMLSNMRDHLAAINEILVYLKKASWTRLRRLPNIDWA